MTTSRPRTTLASLVGRRVELPRQNSPLPLERDCLRLLAWISIHSSVPAAAIAQLGLESAEGALSYVLRRKLATVYEPDRIGLPKVIVSVTNLGVRALVDAGGVYQGSVLSASQTTKALCRHDLTVALCTAQALRVLKAPPTAIGAALRGFGIEHSRAPDAQISCDEWRVAIEMESARKKGSSATYRKMILGLAEAKWSEVWSVFDHESDLRRFAKEKETLLREGYDLPQLENMHEFVRTKTCLEQP